MLYYLFFLIAVLLNCITAILISVQNRKAQQARYDAIMHASKKPVDKYNN